MKHVPHREHVAGVLLAAGRGTRFGADKLLVPLDDAPLVRHVAAMLVRAGVHELVVVTGPDPALIATGLAGVTHAGMDGRPPSTRFTLVPDVHAARGLGTSVAAGIGALGADVEAAIVALGDQPRVPDAVPRALLAAWRGTGAPIVVPRYAGGARGHPVLFDADVFRELSRLEGDEGARSVIARSADRVRLVDVDFAMPVDVDTRDDLARL